MWPTQNAKSETICLTFSPSRFRLAAGNSEYSRRGAAEEMEYKLLAFGLEEGLIHQVKRLI